MVPRGRLLIALVFLGALLVVGGAAAKVSLDSPYTYQQTFGTSLRLLKVDLGHEVTEINSDWGYILFEYVDSESGKRKNRGAITFVKGDDQTTVSVEIPEMPSYHEELMLQKLKHKLQTEHGEPPRPQKEKKKKKKDDKEDGDDDKDDADKDNKDDADKGDDKDKKKKSGKKKS